LNFHSPRLSRFCPKCVSGCAASRETSAPTPLEVKASCDTIHVEDFSGEMHARKRFQFHALPIQALTPNHAARRNEFLLVRAATIHSELVRRQPRPDGSCQNAGSLWSLE